MAKVQKKHSSSPRKQQAVVKKPAKEDKSSRRNPLFLICFLLITASVLLYANTFQHGYVLDDQAVLAQNQLVKKGAGGIGELLYTPYWFGYNGSKDGYRPVSLILFAIEWQIFGDNATAFHVFNVLWYAATVVLLFLTLRRWFGSEWPYFPLFVTLLFMAHPVHTEVVANIKSRDELLSFFFFTASLFYLKGYVDQLRLKKLIPALICFFLALLSKENSVMLLLIVPIILKYFTGLPSKKTVTVSAFYAGIFILYGFVRLAVQGGDLTFRTEIPFSDNALVAAHSFMERLATAIYLLGYYVRLVIFPHPLVSDYSYGFTKILSWSDWQVLLSLVILLAFFAVALMVRKRQRLISFGILFFFITLLLVSNIFFLGGALMAERFLYLPSLGFCIAVVSAAALLLKRNITEEEKLSFPAFLKKHTSFAGVLLAVVIVFSFLTLRRNPDWKDDITLYSTDVKRAPLNVKLNYYYGAAMVKEVKEGKYPQKAAKDAALNEAMEHLAIAIKEYPDYIDANHEMGNAFFWKGEYAKSLDYFERSLKEGSPNAIHYSNYACSLIELNQMEKAEDLLQKAIRINPDYMEAHSNLGTIYARIGRYPEAKEEHMKAYKLSPGTFLVVRNVGSAYGNLKEYDTALFYFNKAYKLNPNDPDLNSYLGYTYQYKGDIQNAQYYFDRAKALRGNP